MSLSPYSVTHLPGLYCLQGNITESAPKLNLCKKSIFVENVLHCKCYTIVSLYLIILPKSIRKIK